MTTAHFLRKNDGVTAIEFAMLAPAFLLLVMATIEIMLVMFAQSVLEGASFSGSRTGKTGFIEQQISREQTILNAIEARAGTLLDVNEITIVQKAYSNFDKVGDPEPFVDSNGNGTRDNGENFTDVNGNGLYDTDMGAAGAGTAGQVVVYTISYPWQIVTPIVSQFFSNNGALTLSARAVIQNEPF